MLTFNVDGYAYDLPVYGSEDGRQMESFPAYLERVFLPQLVASELYSIRCSISGFTFAHLLHSELTQCFKAACIKLGLSRYDTLLDLPSVEQTVDACESIVDEIAIRLVIMSRPGPFLTKNDGAFVLQDLDPNRQLSILLNQLLWDTGMFRANKSSDDVILHLRRMFEQADMIAATDSGNTTGAECLAALIELDAMFRITELRLSRRESDRLIAIRNKSVELLSWAEIKQFALQLLITREKSMSPEIMPARWTQIAFRNQVFQAASREDKSNLMEGIRKASLPSNAHIKAKPGMTRAASPSKPKTAAQEAGAARRARFAALLKGGPKMDGI